MNEIRKEIKQMQQWLKSLNPGLSAQTGPPRSRGRLRKVLVANRGEIAKRFFLVLKEEGISSVAVVTEADRDQSWYEFADEVINIGGADNYTNIPVVVAAALVSDANALYPGYGFLAENHLFVETLLQAAEQENREMIFMGPAAEIMKRVGNKLDARNLAREHGVPLFEGSDPVSGIAEAQAEAQVIGYPVIVKLNAGGGGKGMMPVFEPRELAGAIESAQRIGRAAYNDDVFYLEKLIVRPVHIEVQIFNGTAIGIRKCAVQRRNQKVIEESGECFLDDHMVLSILSAAENMANISGYSGGGGAGTIEFLYDADREKFGFLEVNTRLQVEYPVTDLSVGVDLAKWQVLFFDGRESEIDYENALRLRFVEKDHAIQCRVYAEDADNSYSPSPGKILELDLPTFNGIRCDFGFMKGDQILPDYDPMIGKLIAHGKNRGEAIVRMERALSELYIRGITTNIDQLLRVVRHDEFRNGDYTNNILVDNNDLLSSRHDTGNPRLASVFGALTEYAHLVQKAAAESFNTLDLENILSDSRLSRIPTDFMVDVYGERFRVNLIRTSLSSYYTFVNGRFSGEFEINSRLHGGDDFHIIYQGRSYPLRTDRRPAYTVVRMLNEQGRIVYSRMKISHLGARERTDPPGMIRSPFQGSFVKFSGDAVRNLEFLTRGCRVKKDDPVVTISAMKMEITLRSPVDGIVDYLIEDGDLSRLVRGKTDQGLVLGKSIAEGEILAVVRREGEVVDDTEDRIETAAIDSDHVLDHLNGDQLTDVIRRSPQENIPVFLELITASFMGLYINDKAMKRFEGVLEELDADFWEGLPPALFEKYIEKIIGVYTALKQIFSPTINTNLSFFGELNQLLYHWKDDSYRPSNFFRTVINQLFRLYGISKWSAAKDNPDMEPALLCILRGHHAINNYAGIIVQLLNVISYLEKPSIATDAALNKLILQEESERDDIIARITRRIVTHRNPSARRNREALPGMGISRKYINRYKKFVMDPFLAFPEEETTLSPSEIREHIKKSVKNPQKDLYPAGIPSWVRGELENRFSLLENRYTIRRLYSPLDDILVYFASAREDDGEDGFLCYSFVREGKPIAERNSNGRIVNVQNVEMSAVRAACVLAAYETTGKYQGSRVELLCCGEEKKLDLIGRDPSVLNYVHMIRLSYAVMRFYLHVNISCLIIDLLERRHNSQTPRKKLLSFKIHNGRLILDIMQPRNRRNPYWNGHENERDQRLFDRDKWPVGIWMDECFDPGTGRELTIPSIDQIPSEKGEGFRPVGARIYEGMINGGGALFFMKDSRISGGATGDLEGRKYAAAAYIAYCRNLPLYVWNDGAGANIKQGMVALNRAAEGFMMNSLLANGVSGDLFHSYMRNCPDPVLRELFNELDGQFKLEHQAGIPHSHFLTAVGIGSSTGLDVYGSSQAAIQLMLDSEQSYRVLTGSNVIRAVTGEDLTNYEIGGARVMGNWTGTVDLVADDKLELLGFIRQIQDVFHQERFLESIERTVEAPADSYTVARPELNVLTESLIRMNVDRGEFIPFKDNYHGSRSLVGGFARLGGRKALIMGPRTHMGVRTFASVARARELFAIAEKTRSARILVFGERWYHSLDGEDHLAVRARMDWIHALYRRSGVTINIITHSTGLRKATMNGAADAIIFVKNSLTAENDMKFVRKTATFIVESISDAFDLAHRIINLLNPLESGVGVRSAAPGKDPRLPQDTSCPFDMVESIIDPVFDDSSFLEFYGEMNDPAGGPTLITGLARLRGETVGVIADQPLGGGAPDAPGTEKFRFFMEFLDHHSLPLVMLSSAPGFVPGVKQERLRIQQIGGESLDVNILSRIPVVSVVLNQNFGGRQIHAFSKFLRPGIAYTAMSNAVLAVMGGPAAFDLFQGARFTTLQKEGKVEEAEKLRKEFLDDYNNKARADKDALQTGVLDWVFDDIRDLRTNIEKGLQAAKERTGNTFTDPS